MDWPTVTWAAPGYAWLLLLAAPAILLCRHVAGRRRRDLRRLAGQMPVRGWPAWLGWAAVFLLLVAALCRPQWGQLPQRQQTVGVDILVALDVSRSMLADDLSPSRLAVARQALDALLPELRGDRIGLIAFAGSAFLVCPLTSDHDGFAAVLAEAGPALLPLGGTALAGALNEARRAFGAARASGRHLLVISDGEDHAGDAEALVASARALRATGVTVHGVVVGVPDGGLVPLADGDFLRDSNGSIVKTRPRHDLLASLARAGGGRLLDLSADPRALGALYATDLSAGERRTMTRTRQLLAERYQLPLALALCLLLVGPFLGRARG
jgi:Ca-activated chloride channel family protein